jgi:two-component system, NtrC family, sensor histidine kinase HydH
MQQHGVSRNDWVKVGLILLGILGTSAGHYIVPPGLILWHNFFQRLYYLPIIYAAITFGRKGGILAALGSALCYLPHILMAWHAFPGYVINQYAEIVMFFLVGAVTGVLADEQRQRESALARALEQLQKANRDLQESFDQLKRADRLAAVGHLSAGLAHEIRNPLASIEGAAGILEGGRIQEEQRLEFIGIIKKECRRLNGLLTNLLDFARPRSPARRQLPLVPLFDSIISLVSHTAQKGSIQLIQCVAPPGLEIRGDGEQLKQVVLNLVLNALQAMPRGGVIQLNACRVASMVRVEVVDEGNGVAEGDLEKIFDPFYTTKENGTGLGLAVAFQIVSQHGGTLQALRREGQGMIFRLDLPAGQE